MDQELLMDIENWMLAVCAVSCTLFPLLYAFLAPWYKTRTGIALLGVTIGMAFLIVATAIGRHLPEELIVGHETFWLWFQFFSFLYLTVAMTYFLIELIRVQVRDRRGDRSSVS